MTKIVAITGAGGFIGKRLASGMARRGWKVYAITSHPENISENHQITAIDCNWATSGIGKVVAKAKGATLWVHAAACMDFSDGELLDLYRSNSLLTERLVYSIKCLEREIYLVYISSISVYGKNQEIADNVEPQPQNHYGLSKLLGELLCQASLGKNCLVLRLAGVWGNDKHPKLFINRCLRQARENNPLVIRGNGQGKRNYLWVGDLPAIVSLAYQKKWHGIRLAAGPEAVSIYEMASAIGKRYKVPVRLDERNDTQIEADIIVKRSQDLPVTNFDEGLDIEIGVRD